MTRNQEIVQVYVSGLSIGEIGKKFGLTRARVSQILRTEGCSIRSQRFDLVGKRFGRLVVIKAQEDDKGRLKGWVCKCDCGRETIVPTGRLTSGKTKSCGCLKADIAAMRFTTHGKTVGGKLKKEYELYHAAKRRAKKEGLPFTLELEDIQIPEYCPVLGIKLCPNSGKVGDDSPTLDRLVPELGYTKENIRIISHRANTIKQNASPSELRLVADWLEKELEKLNGK